MSVRSFTLDFLLLLVAVLIGLVLLEVVLSTAHRLNYISPLPYGIRDESTRIDYVRLKPDFDGTSVNGIRYRTNSLGFRDDPIDAELPHVLFLGDSTTFGLGIDHKESYPEQFERMMLGRNQVIQSVNTATPGQGTLDQLAIFDEILNDPRLGITSVVLGFAPNDISNNFEYFSYMESLRLRKPNENWKQWLDENLKRFRTWRFVIGYYFLVKEWLLSPRYERRGRDGETAKEKMPSSEDRTSNRGVLDARLELPTRPGREVEWDILTDEEIAVNRSFVLTIKSVRTLAARCREKGLPFIFVYLPAVVDEITEGKSPRYKRFLRDAVVEHGARYLDMAKIYRATFHSPGVDGSPAEQRYLPRDLAGHPGPEASEVIARALFNEFLRYDPITTTPAH